MKRFLFVLLGVLLFYSGQANFSLIEFDNNNAFTEDEYELALQKSKLEKKLVFLDFHAKWCTPCKWMESTVFKDDRVLKILNEKYITVKVDIDDFDGFDLKQQYAVSSLPTLIFLNDQAKVIERVDETMGISKFLAMIEKQSSKIVPEIHKTNVSPIKKQKNVEPTKIETDITIGKQKNVVVKQIKKTKVPRNKSPKNRGQIKKTYGIKSMEKSKDLKLKKYLALQIGIYSNNKNALKQKEFLESISNLPIKIMEGMLRDKKVYRVFLGQFGSRVSAKRYKYKLQKKYDIKSVVK